MFREFCKKYHVNTIIVLIFIGAAVLQYFDKSAPAAEPPKPTLDGFITALPSFKPLTEAAIPAEAQQVVAIQHTIATALATPGYKPSLEEAQQLASGLKSICFAIQQTPPVADICSEVFFYSQGMEDAKHE